MKRLIVRAYLFMAAEAWEPLGLIVLTVTLVVYELTHETCRP